MERFLYYLREENKSPLTIKAYQQAISEFQYWFKQTTGSDFILDNITPLDLSDYLAYLKNNKKQAQATINKKTGALKTFFKYLYDQKEIEVNPAEKLKIKRISALNRIPRWLTRAEQSRLLHTIRKEKPLVKSTRDIAIYQCMLQAGLRVSEVEGLDVDDLNLKKGIMVIRNGKGNKMRYIIINRDLEKALKEHLKVTAQNGPLFLSKKGNRLSIRGIQHQFKKYFAKANINNATVHCLRHSFCRNLVEKGVDLTLIAQLADHESIETTRIYTTPGILHMKQAIESISSEH